MSLFIAAKVEEICPPRFEKFYQSVKQTNCEAELRQTELDVLQSLGFIAYRPTIFTYLCEVLQ